jgi:predicted TIM-barrel fold metal-dependent hydrolase
VSYHLDVHYQKGVEMSVIAVEEAYATDAFLAGPGRALLAQAEAAKNHPAVAAGIARLVERLCDVGEGRIAEMDAAAVDVAVLSLTAPGVEQLDPAESVVMARDANDRVAAAVRAHPDRFAAFAALPTGAPERAAAELERAVTQLAFRGALINGHAQGRYLDDEFFWPILECAESLGVPVYLHPTMPLPSTVAAHYRGNYSDEVAGALATGAWGWHVDTALHLLRLVASGALDRFPDLQLVLGHLGEALPFMLPRLEQALPPPFTRLARPIGDYLRDNVHYTLSGFTDTASFLTLLLAVGVDRIMFAADHPYGSMTEARAFLDRLPVSPGDRARIAHGNAERLLGPFGPSRPLAGSAHRSA